MYWVPVFMIAILAIIVIGSEMVSREKIIGEEIKIDISSGKNPFIYDGEYINGEKVIRDIGLVTNKTVVNILYWGAFIAILFLYYKIGVFAETSNLWLISTAIGSLFLFGFTNIKKTSSTWAITENYIAKMNGENISIIIHREQIISINKRGNSFWINYYATIKGKKQNRFMTITGIYDAVEVDAALSKWLSGGSSQDMK